MKITLLSLIFCYKLNVTENPKKHTDIALQARLKKENTAATNEEDDKDKAEEEVPVIKPREKRVKWIEKVINKEKFFEYAPVITEYIRDIQAYHNAFYKTLDKWESDTSKAEDDEDAQVQCKPLINTIAQKTTQLSKEWERYYEVMQLQKLDCARKEGEYYYWLWEYQGSEETIRQGSYLFDLNYMKDQKKRLDKCLPAWTELVENELEGQDDCKTEIADGFEKFKTKYKELTDAKVAYFTLFKAKFEAWKTKKDLDRMCRTKSKMFRFRQAAYGNASAEEDSLNDTTYFKFEHNENEKTNRNLLAEHHRFVQMQKDLMQMQYDKSEVEMRLKNLKVQKMGTKNEDQPINECEDCIKVPEKFAYPEVGKTWDLLIKMQEELGNLWYDIQQYNGEALNVKQHCKVRIGDLTAVLNSISYVHSLIDKVRVEWVGCLAERQKKNPDTIKSNIHEAKKNINDMVEELIELEQTLNVDECEQYSNYVKGNIVNLYGQCKANKDSILKQYELLVAQMDIAVKQYAADGALSKAVTAETERLNALTEECTTAYTTTIAKDKFTGDKKRKFCIASDDDNSTVSECYYEHIVPATGGDTPPPAEDAPKFVLVWVDTKMFYCYAPADEPEPFTPDAEGKFDLKEYQMPIINLINPYNCLPGGVSSYDPYVCRVGAQIYQANYANFMEFSATACDNDYKDKFSPCGKVHAAQAEGQGSMAIVQYKEHESFFACTMFDPNSPIEQKFDFTDKGLCSSCRMFEMYKPDDKIVARFVLDTWPKLKGTDKKMINQYIDKAMGIEADDCYLYVDKEALAFMSSVYGKYTTNLSIPSPYNKAITDMQFMPGIKCKYTKEGDKKDWKIDMAYFDPKSFDFAGINKETIEERFTINEDLKAEADTGKRHKLVVKSDYYCLSLRLLNLTANVTWSYYNWLTNPIDMGGKTRYTEINSEMSTNKIGYEALYEKQEEQFAPIYYEQYSRWRIFWNCFKYYGAVLDFWPTSPRKDYSDLFYYANMNLAHTNADTLMYKAREAEDIKAVYGEEFKDESIPVKDADSYKEFDDEKKFINTEINWSTYQDSWAYAHPYHQWYAVIRNTYNLKSYEKASKWGCSQFTEDERWKVGKSNYYFNWASRRYAGLCMYNDRAIKYYSRVKKVEPDNKVLDFYEICIHNWPKETQDILYGVQGDKMVVEVYCKPLKEFLTEMKAAAPPARFKTVNTRKWNKTIGGSQWQQKIGLQERFKMLNTEKIQKAQLQNKNKKMRDEDEVDTEYGKEKKWVPLKEFKHKMSLPMYCTILKKIDGKEGQHMMSKCK